MRVLGFDTADDYCAISLLDAGAVIDTVFVSTERDQARILAPLTQDLLSKHALTPQQIDRFAIAAGPGSFTGIRVGLSFVRGLGLATGKPVLGFDHFTCIARALETEEATLIVRQSKRAELFCCWYKKSQRQGEPFLATAEKINDLLEENPKAMLTGNANALIANAYPELKSRMRDPALPHSATDAALLAAECNHTANFPAHPVYLREADVTFPKQQQA